MSASFVGDGVADHVVVTVAEALSFARPFAASSSVWVPIVETAGPAPVRVVFVAEAAFTNEVDAGNSNTSATIG